ncbi:MAG: molybdopterin oxidoreductase, partial [Bacteroidetes bacterium]|nr:molybdopterin oxidoreductase [Bacteroidota bacterium]
MNHEHDGSEHDVNEGRAGFDRRSFMKLAGFSFAGTLLAGCRQADVEKAIPFLVQPEEIMPGLAYWYATTCGGCNAGSGVLAKCRDGRPIKLEGNPAHPVSRGGLCAMGQASLLGLYDSHRLKNPIIEGQEASWDRVDAEMALELNRIRDSGRPVRFLSG